MIIILEYLGIYTDREDYQVVKIKANSREKADNKFIKYLQAKLINEFNPYYMFVIPLFAVKETL